MKELEKTKRISIAAVLTILIVLIALLSYRRPKHLYSVNTHDTLEKITKGDYFITQNEIDKTSHALLDIRSSFEFEKGHLDQAINMPSPEILNEENTEILNTIKEENKTILMYGNNPNDVVTPFMLLTQLGFDKIKILTVENSYYQNKLITKNTIIEKDAPDVNAFIQESVKKKAEAMKKANLVIKSKPKPAPAPKKIITVKKKKKMPVEGGC